MRKNLIRSATLAATALAGVLSLSACDKGDSGNEASAPAAPSSSTGAAHPAGQASPSQAAPAPAPGGGKGSGSHGTSAEKGAGRPAHSGKAPAPGGKDGADGSGDKKGYGQVCGTNDLAWAAASKSQAGGYIEISVRAKPGITCWLPGVYPVVAIGSDGTEAQPAEQAVGKQIKLSGGTTAYAGLNPKSTNDHSGKELADITVTVSRDSAGDPVGLKVGSTLFDRPEVTNWHSSPQAAVPGIGGQ
ncbi:MULTISPECIES: DUF4232 domain-containing protein [Streptomyces]|uniref:DUF4232 domain-containing protein n=1 Tax=Streptomyces TaxID=1883 RepID=UPI00163BA526|nr:MULTISPECIES: DUF4232 domain-containing protein [Streptomyces]MBC2877355.1 DUF4232 domain-containing protein [Streptomyces sp. TYQ1024]UBI38160.1 DUF4232 domain-containing protein [Streptomyces mobaraensis]UKW30746.1 DUF4232 domain-containing protein [Streptomyces sp. TYQ1024]